MSTWHTGTWQQVKKRKSKTIFDLRVAAFQQFRCPRCGAEKLQPCTEPYAGGRITTRSVHDERTVLAILKYGDP